MRCCDCHTEPLTPGHYCECCGRKLSVQELQGAEADRSADAMQGELPFDQSARCGSCGAPAVDGDLCQPCQDAFSSLLGGASMDDVTESVASVDPVDDVDPHVASIFAQLATVDVAADADAHVAGATVEPAAAVAAPPASISVAPVASVEAPVGNVVNVVAHHAGADADEPGVPMEPVANVSAPVASVSAQAVASVEPPVVNVVHVVDVVNANAANVVDLDAHVPSVDDAPPSTQALFDAIEAIAAAAAAANAQPQSVTPAEAVAAVDNSAYAPATPFVDVADAIAAVPVSVPEPAAKVVEPTVQVSAVAPVSVPHEFAPVADVRPTAHVQQQPAPVVAAVEPAPVVDAPPAVAVNKVAVAVVAAMSEAAPVAQSVPTPEASSPASQVSAAEEKPAKPAAAPQATAKREPVAAPVKPRRNRAELVAVAVVVVAAMVGIPAGAMWLRNQVPGQTAESAPEPVAAPKEPPAARRAPAPAPPVEEVAAPAPAPAEPVAASSPAPRAVAQVATSGRPARVAAPKGRQPAAAPQPVASTLASSAVAAVPVAPPPVVEAPPAPAPAPQQLAVAEPPAGKLFDQSEVDESPRITNRVQPQVPGGLPGRATSDVVVVRILVSQTGHPFRVNLLRKSRLGSSVDEAVIAAVKQWSFTPARKRGEPVSCWFNFGVSLTAN